MHARRHTPAEPLKLKNSPQRMRVSCSIAK